MAAAPQAPPVHGSLADMDSHIARLKDKVEEQRKGLQHWQTWDAEYEALKEEVQALPESATVEQLQRIHAGFDGELLVGKELDEIFGQQLRSRNQIVNVLDRRIDYVNHNVRALQTQLEKTELEVLDAEASNEQGAVDENGPPITEIVEELDEEGNILSFRLNRPGEALPRVKAALEKVGIDAPSLEPSSLKPQPESTSPSVTKTQPAKKVKESIPLTPHESEPDQEVTAPISRMAKRVDGIMKTAKEQEKISTQPAVVPDDEDPDDASLRQQMLKYSMGEMGAVVAELNLEEEDDEDDDFDDDEWLEGDDIDEEDEDEEDKYGRFTGRMVTDKYQRRMLELETKLGVKSRFTQKLEDKEAENGSDDDDGEGIGRIRIQPKPAPSSSASPSAAPTKSIVKERTTANNEPKKGVRFANELDIADEAEPSAALPDSKPDISSDIVEPMSELIVERKPASKPAAAPPTQRPSRFKKAAAAAQNQPSIPKGPLDVPASFLAQHEQEEERPFPTGPEGRTIADTLVEKGSVSRPANPAVLDDSMMGVAAEHQRLRSRFIRRDGGGFLQETEGPVERLDEAEGGSERVSRFKAARLSRQ